MKVSIGIDQGSSSTKIVLVDEKCQVIWREVTPVETIRSTDIDYVEQDANKILADLKKLLNEAIYKAKELNLEIISIGLSTQRSAVTAWSKNPDKNGIALHPIITWRDKRTKLEIEKILNYKDFVTRKTGLPLLPDYAGSKISLLQKKFPNDFVGTLDSFLIYNLSDQKEFVTDDSMASRTLLYDLTSANWSKELTDIFSVDISRLPRLLSSFHSSLTYQGLPFTATIGDGQAALYSYFSEQYKTLLNLGTISSLVKETSSIIELKGILSGIFYTTKKEKKYLLEAVTISSGEVVTKISNLLKIEDLDNFMSEVKLPTNIPKLLAYLPINGTGSPDWKVGLPLVFSDDPSKYSAQEVMLVSLLSIGSFISRNIEIFKENGQILKDQILPVVGGISKSESLLEYISAITNIQLGVTEQSEGSALGVAKLAGNFNKNLTIKFSSIISSKNLWCKDYYNQWLKLEDQVLANNIESYFQIK